MFIIISGGGKIGSFLAQDLAGKGHGVVLIERRPEIVERLARELPPGVLVIAGDGAEACGVVARRLDAFGFDTVDAGPLAEGGRIQRDTPGYGPRRNKLELRADLAAARRYRDM